jgi:hypothetical protein
MLLFCDSCSKDLYTLKSEACAASKGIWGDDKIKMTVYKCPEKLGYHLATARTGKRLKLIPHRLNDIVNISKKKKR